MMSNDKHDRPPATTDEISGAGTPPAMIGDQESGVLLQRPPAKSDAYVQLAKLIRRLRGSRSELLPSHLFGEASWDILIALYIAHREQYRMTIMTVCNEAGVPLTTALRWLQQLVDEGLAVRRSNPLDRRTTHVELSPAGIQTMDRLLDTVL